MERRDDVLRRPEPRVVFTDFGDSALQFELRFWPARFESWVAVASAVRETILRELWRAGVSIPFPQRDVNIRSGDDLMRRLAARNAPAPPQRPLTERPNDIEAGR